MPDWVAEAMVETISNTLLSARDNVVPKIKLRVSHMQSMCSTTLTASFVPKILGYLICNMIYKFINRKLHSYFRLGFRHTMYQQQALHQCIFRVCICMEG